MALLQARQYAISRELLEKGASAGRASRTRVALAIAAFHFERTDGLKQMERVPESARNAQIIALAQMLDAVGKESRCPSLDRALLAAPDRGRDLLAEDGLPEKGRSCPERPRSRPSEEVMPRGPSCDAGALLESSGRTEQARRVTRGFATPLARIAGGVGSGRTSGVRENPGRPGARLGPRYRSGRTALSDGESRRSQSELAIRADATLLLPAATGLVVGLPRRYCPPAFRSQVFLFAEAARKPRARCAP